MCYDKIIVNVAACGIPGCVRVCAVRCGVNRTHYYIVFYHFNNS